MAIQITHRNFDEVFTDWKKSFDIEREPQEEVLAFLKDLQMQANKDVSANLYIIRCEPINSANVTVDPITIPSARYERFWAKYDRPVASDELIKIQEQKDSIVAMGMRRSTGEFFTPFFYANLAHRYLADVIPDRYRGLGHYHSMYDDYNWWDPACGTGNLTFDCPFGMQGKLFMSTLNQEDVDINKASGRNPNALIFAYNFVDQDYDELPDELKDALGNGKPWIFILNPPYAAGTGGIGVSQKDFENTKLVVTSTGKEMRERKMGAGSQNPMNQFIYRIRDLSEKYDLDTTIGLFSNCNIWTGSGLGRIRDVFRERFIPVGGFCFHCQVFHGITGEWPVTYSVWLTGENDKDLVVDVIENDEVTGTKVFKPAINPMSRWIDRPDNTVIRPPMRGALGVVDKPDVASNKLSNNAIAYMRSTSNDVQHNRMSFILSGPYHGGAGWSVTSDNFADSMVHFAVRKLIDNNWLNNRDEYEIPDINQPGYSQFANDAAVWALFIGSNNTSSLGNVKYQGKIYDIPNNFFWIAPEVMLEFDSIPRIIWEQCQDATRSFVVSWLDGRELSNDVIDLLHFSHDLVEISMPYRSMARPEFQLDRYDAGWYQVRMGLFHKKYANFELSERIMLMMRRFMELHRKIKDRLIPYVYDLGFLPEEKVTK